MNPPNHHDTTRIAVKSGAELTLLKPSEIECIEANDNYVHIWHKGQRHPRRGPLKCLAKRLARHGFIRIHRSILVNANSVASLRQLPDGRASITLQSGKCLTVSRNAARRTRQILLNTF
ncbi:MAG: hypothetical protein RI897_1585 [Verrucomicrobiota bacterium]|jgi:two-component system LytT family response regulator